MLFNDILLVARPEGNDEHGGLVLGRGLIELLTVASVEKPVVGIDEASHGLFALTVLPMRPCCAHCLPLYFQALRHPPGAFRAHQRVRHDRSLHAPALAVAQCREAERRPVAAPKRPVPRPTLWALRSQAEHVALRPQVVPRAREQMRLLAENEAQRDDWASRIEAAREHARQGR